MTTENKRLVRLQAERDTTATHLRSLADKAEEEDRDLTDVEVSVRDSHMAEMAKLDAEIKVESDIALRNADAAALAAKVGGIEPTTVQHISVHEDEFYNAKNGITRSWFADVVAAKEGDQQARENLANHARDLNQRSVTTTTASDITPPSYLLDQFAEYARSGRPVANAIGSHDLSAGSGMTFYVPKGTGGTSTGVQATENTTISNTDPTFSSIALNVQTIAGYVDVSVQELRQSGIAIDSIIYGDLVRDYNQKIETMVVNGTGTNAKGIFQLAGTGAVGYNGSTLGVFKTNELYAKVLEAVTTVEVNRFAPAEVVIMHPRRWNLALSKSDTTNRPLLAPVAPMNSGGTFSLGVEGFRGEFAGLPVLTSHAVSTAYAEGAGATPTGDEVAVARLSDFLLFESGPTRATFEDVGSATMTVRFRVAGFAAFTAARYLASTAIISGHALTDSTF